jgi:type I restriction enzyme S subunit
MKWPPYLKYKPSGVEWFGDVPEHWDVLRLSRLVACLDGRRIPLNRTERSDRQGPYPYWGANGIVDHIDHWLFDEPLVLLGEDGAPFFALNKEVAFYVTGKIWVNNHAHVLRSTPRIDGRFLASTLNQTAFGAFIDGSTRDKLTQDDMWAIPVPTPPLSEQSAITDFLDRETAKIDTLVAKKRTLIERLKEKRTALISRAVTRGLPPDAARAAALDPHPKLKPSGIEWLGDVPEHWDVSRIKYVARIESGHTPSRSVDEYWVDCTIPWVSLNDSGYLRTHDYITSTVHSINELGLANSSARMLPPRVVVFSRDATVGLCAITTRPMAVSQHFVAYVCGRRLLPEYLLASLDVMGQHLVSLSLGATISTIGMDDVRSLSCAIPPYAEQEAIVEFLSHAKAKVDRMVSKVETAIDRLQEYRTALITAAVTGKIDVRPKTPAA